MKNAYIAAGVLIVAGLFAYAGLRAQPAGEPIKVGVILPLTGVVARFGEDARAGIESVPHEGIEFIFEDEECENPPTLSAYQKLVSVDRVHFILGPGCGGPQEVVAPLLKGKDVLAIVPSAASSDLYQKSGGNLYNIQYALEDEARFLAEQMSTRGHKNIALISYQNAFSQVMRGTFTKNFSGHIVRDIVFQSDSADVSTELAKLKGLNIDAVYSTDVIFLFAQGPQKLREYGVTAPLWSSYPVELPSIVELAEGIIHSSPGDMDDSRGVVYGLAKQSAEVLVQNIKECGGDYACVKQRLDSSGQFKDGVRERPIILKTIEGGVPKQI